MTDQLLRRLRASVRSASYLRKWVALGFAIGVVAGFGAIIFFWSLGTATHLFLGLVAGLTPPTPAGEGAKPITDALRPWAIPIVTGVGGKQIIVEDPSGNPVELFEPGRDEARLQSRP